MICNDLEFIQEVEVPQFKLRIELSKKRRKKYYKKKNTLPKTYQQKVDDGIWSFKKVGKYYYLIDEEGNRVLQNPRAAGTPKYHKLAGNDFTSGMHYGKRKTIVKKLRASFKEHTHALDPIRDYPIIILWEMHTTLDREHNRWDASNMWFYYKYFEDVLFKDDHGNQIPNPIIFDDSYKYITGVAGPILYPVNTIEERKLIFKFYKDNRNINHPIWNA